jgi:hypothetical protein
LIRYCASAALAQILSSRALAGSALIGLIVAAAVSHAATVLATWSAVSLGADHRGGIVGTFRDSSAASTGFTSVPTARALTNPPRWLSANAVALRAGAAAAAPEARLSLAVVGLPIDVQHDMLRKVTTDSYCLAPQQSKTTVSLCKDPKQLYEKFAFSGTYNLCDFDPDCWHSTAVAIVASGNEIDSARYPFSSWSGAAEFKTVTFAQIARARYAEITLPGSYTNKTTFPKFVSEQFEGYKEILNTPMRIATVQYTVTGTRDGNPNYNSTYISKQMIIDKGVRNGGTILAFNVFSRFESAIECDEHKKFAPCVLTTTGAQEEALNHILETVQARETPGANNRGPSLGAIVIVAGGALTDKRCDNTRTAELIAALRRRGVLTFVPVGNDGNPAKVRFPACASQAVSVGSLTRDGAISSLSNGSQTNMVALYTDGETAVLPIRGPRMEQWMFSRTAPEPCDKSNCKVRKPNDQYNVYLAGGTLLSTAVASGAFLNVRERHPKRSPEEVLASFKGKRTSSSPSMPVEADEYVAQQVLAQP